MTFHRTRWAILLGSSLAIALATTTGPLAANATPGLIGSADFLGTAQTLAVLGGQSVTNTGPSVIDGDVAVSPGTSVTGFPPGLVNGTIYGPPATQANGGQTDASNAFDSLGVPAGTAVPNDLGGYLYGPGVYQGQPGGGDLSITGTLVLNGGADDVFIFQSSSTLVTASGSSVVLTGGARACNVFWRVGSSATLGSNSVIAGTIIARTSITATTGAAVGAGADDGARLLALDGSVTLDSNVIRSPSACNDTTVPTSSTGGTTISPTDQAAADAATAAALAAAAAARAAVPVVTPPSTPTTPRNTLLNTGGTLAATALDARPYLSIAGSALALGFGLIVLGQRRVRLAETRAARVSRQ
jgi:hypothetical protein